MKKISKKKRNEKVFTTKKINYEVLYMYMHYALKKSL